MDKLIKIDETTHKRIKLEATKEDKTIKALVSEVLNGYVEKKENGNK